MTFLDFASLLDKWTKLEHEVFWAREIFIKIKMVQVTCKRGSVPGPTPHTLSLSLSSSNNESFIDPSPSFYKFP